MSDDDFLHARPHEGLRARRGAAKVVTRFKRHVRHGPVGGMPLFLGVVDGHLFSVQTTKMVVPTLRNDGVVFDQNAANEGLGLTLPRPRSAISNACSMWARSSSVQSSLTSRPRTSCS